MPKLSRYTKDPLRILYGVIRRIAPWIKNDERYLKMLFFLRHRKRLNLKHPETFSEKLQWLKLYDRKPEYTTMVDKYAVKAYVANIIGEEYIIPTIGVWDKPEDIDWDSLSDKFVLKTTHGGGSVGVVICRNKESFNKEKAIKNLNKSLKQDIYIELREWPYKNVKKQIIAEPFMEDDNNDSQDLPDYKFFCFNGVPKYCQVIKDRNKTETIDFFDMDWNHQEFIGLNPVKGTQYHNAIVLPSIPKHFQEMQVIASQLSKNIPFSRIDLYEINGKVYFGEITLFPASGMGVFKPEEWNKSLGDMLDLSLCQTS